MADRHEPPRHAFGGDWTETKLTILREYLRQYTIALKNTPFSKVYIDAFAGTGYRTEPGSDSPGADELLFPELAEPDPQQLRDGSAVIALKTEPAFDEFIFIEKDPTRCVHLKDLEQQFPSHLGKIDVRNADANAEIQALCRGNWRGRRAVLFLDPYGMQVEWATIRMIAETKSIDLWLLFPLGMGVNRLLTRTGEIPAGWRTRLELILGTTDWYDEFYPRSPSMTLFDEIEPARTKAPIDAIGRYFVRRLETVFEGVVKSPTILQNSAGCPLYLLCFAVGNKRGSPIALRIAKSIMKKLG